MKKNLLIFTVLFCVLSGCWGGNVRHQNNEPEDDIAVSLVNVIGSDYWYMGRTDTFNGDGVNYSLLVQNGNGDTVASIAGTITNIELNENSLVQFSFLKEIANGVYEPIFYLKNYTINSEDDVIRWDRADCLTIKCLDFGLNESWGDLSDFTVIESIRYVEIPDYLQKQAEEDGIDWYEVWPELEEIIVFETDK